MLSNSKFDVFKVGSLVELRRKGTGNLIGTIEMYFGNVPKSGICQLATGLLVAYSSYLDLYSKI